MVRMLLFEKPPCAPRQGFFDGFRRSNGRWGGSTLNELRLPRHVGVIQDKLQGKIVWFPRTRLDPLGGRGEKTFGQPPQEIYEEIHI